MYSPNRTTVSRHMSNLRQVSEQERGSERVVRARTPVSFLSCQVLGLSIRCFLCFYCFFYFVFNIIVFLIRFSSFPLLYVFFLILEIFFVLLVLFLYAHCVFCISLIFSINSTGRSQHHNIPFIRLLWHI